MNEHCTEHLATLLRTIDSGEEIPAGVRAHLSTCAECARLLEAMNRVHADVDRADTAASDEAVVAETLQASAAAVNHSRRIRRVVTAIAVTVVLIAGAVMIGYGVQSLEEGLFVVGLTTLIIAPLFVTIALIVMLRQRMHAPGRPIYKRLKPGRQLDGVCLGLAEATGVQVILLRVAFVALFFASGTGFWLYILFALVMPVHPDDRQYLLRFQLMRAFRRMTSRV